MNNKKINKKFRSKGFILRPESLEYIGQNIRRVDTLRTREGFGEDFDPLAFLVGKCQEHFHQNDLTTNIIEPKIIQSVVENLFNFKGFGTCLGFISLGYIYFFHSSHNKAKNRKKLKSKAKVRKHRFEVGCWTITCLCTPTFASKSTLMNTPITPFRLSRIAFSIQVSRQIFWTLMQEFCIR